MRIMCLNGWGGTLHGALTDYVGAVRPEVLCLQEVIHCPETPKDWLEYRDGDHVLPQRADFLGDVAAALPEHWAIFCPAARGMLWDGEAEVVSLWGLATFVHRDLLVVGQAQGFVHGAFSPDGFGDHPRSRNAHAVRLWDGAGFVTIAHMHGLRDLAGKMDSPDRKAQAERFSALADGVAVAGDTVVLCGDFNVGPESETLAILSRGGLTEQVTAHREAGTRTSHYRKPMRFADYMLVNDSARVQDFEVIRDPEVSDHCPLLLTLRAP